MKTTLQKLYFVIIWSQNSDANEWKWSDTSILQYTNWAGGEPNGEDFNPPENCVEMYHSGYSGFWNDQRCDDNRYYICKAPKRML